MLSLVGADGLSNRRIGELSGGQQQRVMVARALAGNPELLLLDEPTSGVDYAASNRIFQLLGQLNHNLGITVIMITHDIAQATQWATKVACINRGLCFYDTSDRFRKEHAQLGHLWF
jgi:zinc transport system ATP-binding protein